MTREETILLLGVAATLDARLKAGSDADVVAKAEMWSLALDSDMPAEWARHAVARHYAEATSTLMPADLNRLWRAERRVRVEMEARERQQRELAAQAAQAVPMPDEVRELIATLKAKAVPNG